MGGAKVTRNCAHPQAQKCQNLTENYQKIGPKEALTLAILERIDCTEREVLEMKKKEKQAILNRIFYPLLVFLVYKYYLEDRLCKVLGTRNLSTRRFW